MRFQLLSDWPASAAVMEKGTIIDGHDPKWRGVPMPLEVLCLDQEAANAMEAWYPHLAADGMNVTPVHYAAGVTHTPKKDT
jgi:hypothetical protein